MAGAKHLGKELAPVVADEFLLNEAIEVLRRYSLVKRDPDAKVLNIHRLVQVVLKDSLDQASQREWAERSVRAVNRAFPEVAFAAWERGELYLPHALQCVQWIWQYGFTFPEAARLLPEPHQRPDEAEAVDSTATPRCRRGRPASLRVVAHVRSMTSSTGRRGVAIACGA